MLEALELDRPIWSLEALLNTADRGVLQLNSSEKPIKVMQRLLAGASWIGKQRCNKSGELSSLSVSATSFLIATKNDINGWRVC